MASGGVRPGAGRPVLPEDQKKSRKPSLIISVTEEQRQEIKRKAKLSKKKLSAYILDLIFENQNELLN